MSGNVEKEQRILEVATGKVKKALCLKRENRKDVTNEWRRGRVYAGRELVAKWEDGNMKLLVGEVLGMADRIKELKKEEAGVEGVEIVQAGPV